MNCKYCGRETKETEFNQFFTKEAFEELPCCPECQQEQIKKASENIKVAGLTHNQDYICPVCGKATKADLLFDPYWAITPNQKFDPLMITCTDCKNKESEVF
jgi:hypothetical protein